MKTARYLVDMDERNLNRVWTGNLHTWGGAEIKIEVAVDKVLVTVSSDDTYADFMAQLNDGIFENINWKGWREI